MTESSVVIPPDINHVISERATLWQKFDEAESQFSEINKLTSHQIASSTPAPIPSELTDEKTPPAEVAIALKNLQTELSLISKSTESIEDYEIEIQQIEKNRRTAIVIGVVLMIITLFILYLAVTGNL